MWIYMSFSNLQLRQLNKNVSLKYASCGMILLRARFIAAMRRFHEEQDTAALHFMKRKTELHTCAMV